MREDCRVSLRSVSSIPILTAAVLQTPQIRMLKRRKALPCLVPFHGTSHVSHAP
jgi:hypothetical protein